MMTLSTAVTQPAQLITTRASVDCLKAAVDSSIPSKGPGKHPYIAGWSQFVKPELQTSQW